MFWTTNTIDRLHNCNLKREKINVEREEEEGGVTIEQMAEILLHGDLHATIYEIDNLHLGFLAKFYHKVVEGIEEAAGFNNTTSRLYATIDLEKSRVGRTRLLHHHNSNPRWDESFHIYCAHTASKLSFTIKVDNAIGTHLVGTSHIPVADLIRSDQVDTWLDILDHRGKPIKGHPRLHVRLHFYDVARERCWSRGIKSPNYPGVPYTFFPQRKGCKITLYQDAHVADGFLPEIALAGGAHYRPRRCWEDIFDTISNAKHLIYITGWSVYTKITLIRDVKRPKEGGEMNLGELLIQKANEGVRVLMLVWDERTSVKLLKNDGLLATHDEDTGSYFRNTAVNCVLCPRNPDDGRSFAQGLEIGTMFSHHQKMVVADAAMPGEGEKSMISRIVSFIGGIDLCDGRYDTQSHPLFKTLATVHRDDFHQANCEGADIRKGGPREPWHDIHCKVEGAAAWDVLFNFEQRWRKQGGKDLLLPLQELRGVVAPPSPVMFPDDHDTWNVQVFRSIDGGAAFGFPEQPQEAARSGLISGKDNIIDRSIQDAYIHAIRRANKFIYIENQYFIGSSFSWSSSDIKDEDVGALHLIPKELSLKIACKIADGEPFRVYVVVPMWPEGFPDSAAVQTILSWQKRTMEMMYTDVAEALKAKGGGGRAADLREYLTFFCLGNREVKRNGEYEPPLKPEADTYYSRSQQSRRGMIYVHSKMMIVDDEYIIIGSANINQRSMDGARDSEIAMGAYQPYHLSCKKPARGEIHGFRMALWYEHLGLLDDAFCRPERLECIQKVNRMAERNWDLYMAETAECDLPAHLLPYPIRVSSSGGVSELPGTENFPDTTAPVIGAVAQLYPSILTT